jgi:hypothetical protein
MPRSGRTRSTFAAGAVLALVLAGTAWTQTAPINTLPNPYRSIDGWARMPAGRVWGSTSGVDIDRDGRSVWVAERCGTFSPPSLMKPGVPFACDGSRLAPILKFDPAGQLVASFGASLLLFPHGLHVDRDGNVWVTDGLGHDGKGQQVFKFSPDGKVLMVLGQAGVAGSGDNQFNAPSAVLVAPNGDIFVADGHGNNTNARIVKFAPDGKFIKTWGTRARGRASSTSRMRWRWIRVDGCSSPIATTTASRFSTRTAAFSTRGRSSAGRAASTSTRTTRSMSPIPSRSRSPRTMTAGNAACASAARATAR